MGVTCDSGSNLIQQRSKNSHEHRLIEDFDVSKATWQMIDSSLQPVPIKSRRWPKVTCWRTDLPGQAPLSAPYIVANILAASKAEETVPWFTAPKGMYHDM